MSGNLWVKNKSKLHLDLAFAAFWDLYIIESDVSLTVESECFHHLDRLQ